MAATSTVEAEAAQAPVGHEIPCTAAQPSAEAGRAVSALPISHPIRVTLPYPRMPMEPIGWLTISSTRFSI